MVAAGLQFSAGSIIDASFVEATKQRNTPEENASIKETGQAPDDWSEGKKRQKDVDARWVKKATKSILATNIITNQKTTPTNVKDIEPMLDLMQENTKILFAESAYLGKEKKAKLAQKHITLRAVKKRARGQEELSDQDKAYNHQVAKIRCRVEHVFGSIKQMGGDYVRSIGLKRCERFINLVSLCYNMKRFGFLCSLGKLCPNV